MLRSSVLFICVSFLASCALILNPAPERFKRQFGKDATPIYVSGIMSTIHDRVLSKVKKCYEKQKRSQNNKAYYSSRFDKTETHDYIYAVKSEERKGKRSILVSYDKHIDGKKIEYNNTLIAVVTFTQESGKVAIMRYQKDKKIYEAIEAWATGEGDHACPELSF